MNNYDDDDGDDIYLKFAIAKNKFYFFYFL